MSFAPRLEKLPEPQRALWPELAQVPANFVLYGGSGLALRLGHRESVDFDFFSDREFEPGGLLRSLALLKGAKVLDSKANRLTALVDRGGPVKLSFFGGLTFGRVRDPEWTSDRVLRAASALDIGASKLGGILERSEAKDYFDVWALLESGVTLAEMLGAACAVYEQFNPMIPLRALSYFEDGDLKTLSDPGKLALARAAGAACAGDIPRMIRLPGGLVPAGS